MSDLTETVMPDRVHPVDLDPLVDVGADAPESVEQDSGSPLLLFGLIGGLLALGYFVSWWWPGIVGGLMFILFMHEFGHYITARMSGMKVTEFFLGFGPRIWSFHRGETEYGLKAIPAGAYVRIMGMTWLDEIDPAEEDRTYRAQPWWQRMMTICAGSAMHFVMALVALVALFSVYEYQGFNGPPWEVNLVVPGSTAENIGVEVGDRPVAVNGTEVETWDDFRASVAGLLVAPIELEVIRDGDRIELAGVTGARSEDVVGAGFGIAVDSPEANGAWTVSAVRPESNASNLGLAVGDEVLSVNDVDLPTQSELAAALLAAEPAPVEITVLRSGSEVVVDGAVSLDRSIPFRGFIGVGAGWEPTEGATVSESIGLAVDDFGDIAVSNITGLAQMLSPSNLANFFSGSNEQSANAPSPTVPLPEPDEDAGRPVSIIGIGRLFAASENVAEVLFLFAIVNIFVGVFNLVPLLPLDGGHAAIATWERLRQVVSRRPYRANIERLIPLTWGVLTLLVVIGGWAAFLDIFQWQSPTGT